MAFMRRCLAHLFWRFKIILFFLLTLSQRWVNVFYQVGNSSQPSTPEDVGSKKENRMENKIKTPVMIVTSDRWSSSPYIVLREETLGMQSRTNGLKKDFMNMSANAEENGDPIESTREEIAEEMELILNLKTPLWMGLMLKNDLLA